MLNTKHLLAEHRAIEDARIAKNKADAKRPPYEPGWSFPEGRATPVLYPYHLALDEFETPDDRQPRRLKVDLALALDAIEIPRGLRVEFVATARRAAQASLTPRAKDYSDASEGPGRVTVCGSDYDIEEAEVFSPYDATVRYRNSDGGWKAKRRATADEENTLGFDAESDLVGKMTEAVKAWAGMTTPPPKTADPTVELLILDYLAGGGEVLSCKAYRTTPISKVRVKPGSKWTAVTGIPPELRQTKVLFRVRPRAGSKQWTNAA